MKTLQTNSNPIEKALLIVCVISLILSGVFSCTPFGIAGEEKEQERVSMRNVPDWEGNGGGTVEDQSRSFVDDFIYYYDKLGSVPLFILFAIFKWVIVPLKSQWVALENDLTEFKDSIQQIRVLLDQISKRLDRREHEEEK